MTEENIDTDTKEIDLETILRDSLEKGGSSATVMSSSCHGGGGGTTTNAPGCSEVG